MEGQMAAMEASGIAIDWDRGLVTASSGRKAVVRAQSLAVLKELYDRTGSLVAKEDLIAKVWSGVAVTDDSLNQCIAELRRALADEDHTIIKTLSKRGYILDLPHVRALTGKDGAPYYVTAMEATGRAPSSETQVAEKSIAVLPFANLSDEAGQDFFVDGLSEDIITTLVNTPGLFTSARNSAFAYKGKAVAARQVAYDLGVTYVLEGSVRRAGERLRVSFQLVDGRNGGQQIWAERIDHVLTEVFEAQDQLANAITAKIFGTLQLGARRRNFSPPHPKAFELCVRSRDVFNRSRVMCEFAQQNCDAALKIEPLNLEAHLLLALCHGSLWYNWSLEERVHSSIALDFANRAIEIRPKSGWVHTVASWVHITRGDLDLAHREIESAFELSPNSHVAYACLADLHMLNGRVENALDCCAKTFRIDPHASGYCTWMLGAAFYHAGRYDDAVTQLRRPETHRSGSQAILAAALAMAGRKDEAKFEAGQYLELNPGWRTLRDAPKRPFQIAEHRERFIEGFQQAGLPD
jgi:TolB-like protein